MTVALDSLLLLEHRDKMFYYTYIRILIISRVSLTCVVQILNLSIKS